MTRRSKIIVSLTVVAALSWVAVAAGGDGTSLYAAVVTVTAVLSSALLGLYLYLLVMFSGQQDDADFYR